MIKTMLNFNLFPLIHCLPNRVISLFLLYSIDWQIFPFIKHLILNNSNYWKVTVIQLFVLGWNKRSCFTSCVYLLFPKDIRIIKHMTFPIKVQFLYRTSGYSGFYLRYSLTPPPPKKTNKKPYLYYRKPMHPTTPHSGLYNDSVLTVSSAWYFRC